MKRITIDLATYIKCGGRLDNLELNVTKSTFWDRNKGEKIKSITHGAINFSAKKPIQLYKIVFANGNTHEYSGIWIETSIDFVLDQKYLIII